MTTAVAQFIGQDKLLDGASHQLDNPVISNSNNNYIPDDHKVDDVYEEASDGCSGNPLEERSSNYSEEIKAEIKCSAVHTLERDMPDFDYSHLVSELRHRILNECQQNEGMYSQADIEKCKRDDWFISRFLLRQKLDVEAALVMLKKAMRFNNESLTSAIRREDFPAEFYKLGGLFTYEPDRKGNKMLYIRVRLHRKVPEIQSLLHAFLYQHIRDCDQEADGKGISILFDCSGGGLSNADMDTVFFLATTLVNYFPKGLSYLLVHELPWILKPFWHIAKAWIPEEYKQLIKFSNSRTIFEYIDKENLPDFMGGVCKRDYRAVPENCSTMEQAAKLWGVEGHIVKRILLKFAEHLPAESVERAVELAKKQGDALGCGDAAGENDSDQENRP